MFTRLITDILIDQGYALDGSYKSMTKGNVSRLGESMYVPSKGDLMLNMVRNKLSPAAALGWDYAFSVLDTEEGTRELSGRQIDLQENFANNLKPMYWQAVKETAEEQPLLTASYLDAMGFFGSSVNTLKEQTKTQSQKLEATLNPNKEVEKLTKEKVNKAMEQGNAIETKRIIDKSSDPNTLIDELRKSNSQTPSEKKYGDALMPILSYAQGDGSGLIIYDKESMVGEAKDVIKDKSLAESALETYKKEFKIQKRKLKALSDATGFDYTTSLVDYLDMTKPAKPLSTVPLPK